MCDNERDFLPTGQMEPRFLCTAASLPTCPPTPCTCPCRCCGGSRCMLVTITCNSKLKKCVCKPSAQIWSFTFIMSRLNFESLHFFLLPLISQAAVAASQPPSAASPPSSPSPSSPHPPAQPNEAVQPPLGGPNPDPNPLPENQPANPNIQMNAQGGAVMNDDELNRDWLDWLYTVSRAGVLLSIVYFYSSFSRFVMVVGAMLLVYLWVNAAQHWKNTYLQIDV